MRTVSCIQMSSIKEFGRTNYHARCDTRTFRKLSSIALNWVSVPTEHGEGSTEFASARPTCSSATAKFRAEFSSYSLPRV
jgi:hypothetical protein